MHQSPPPPPSDVGPTTPTPSILSLSFNQDSTCFAAATTTTGFSIFNSIPFRHIFTRNNLAGTIAGGIGIRIRQVQMLHRCNILALVADDSSSDSSSKVLIWDDHRSRVIGELTFRTDTPPLSVRLTRRCIVVVLLHKIYVYDFEDLRLVHQIETVSNPRGVCEVTEVEEDEIVVVVVCLGLKKGEVRVEECGGRKGRRTTRFVRVCEPSVRAVAVTRDGRMVATGSAKGTIVRVWDARDGTLLQEVRRGTDRAQIHCLAFSPNAQWLAVSSDRGTVHVFGLKVDPVSPETNALPTTTTSHSSPQTPKSSLSLIKGVLPLPKYFNSEWSVAKFHLQEGSHYIVAFGQEENTIVILGMDGSYYHCKFDPVAGGEMTLSEHHSFLKQEQLSQS